MAGAMSQSGLAEQLDEPLSKIESSVGLLMPTFLMDIFRRQCMIQWWYIVLFFKCFVLSLLVTEVRQNTKALNVMMMHLNKAVSQYLKFCSSSVFTHHSHTRRLLSSDVLTNRRFSSTKVMVLTAPRWRSYSWTTSPVLMSHWWRDKGKVDY